MALAGYDTACLGTFTPQVTLSLFVIIFVKCVVSVCYDTHWCKDAQLK